MQCIWSSIGCPKKGNTFDWLQNQRLLFNHQNSFRLQSKTLQLRFWDQVRSNPIRIDRDTLILKLTLISFSHKILLFLASQIWYGLSKTYSCISVCVFLAAKSIKVFFSFLFTLLKWKGFSCSFGYIKHKIWDVPPAQQPTNIRQLSAAVTRECQNIHVVLIQNACNGMVDRCHRWCQNTSGNSFSNE